MSTQRSEKSRVATSSLLIFFFFFNKLFFINSPLFTFSAGFQKSKQTASPEIKPELWTGPDDAQQTKNPNNQSAVVAIQLDSNTLLLCQHV